MQFILKTIIYYFARFLQLSYRFDYSGKENLAALKDKNANHILAIWHQNLLAGILAQRDLTNPYVVIVSKSKDAEPVAYTCERLGHLVVRGSSKKGGKDKGGQSAKLEMIECLKKGHPGAVTIDGPKGPAFKPKRGIIDMAKEAGTYIVPYTIEPKLYYQFKSWDQFKLPIPFSKVLVHYGKPIDVKNLSVEEVSTILETKCFFENNLH